MAEQEADPTVISVLVDGRSYTEVVAVEWDQGHLALTDTSGWVATYAPGSWGSAVRKDDGLPDAPGANPRNLS
jgi:hypothetical protein